MKSCEKRVVDVLQAEEAQLANGCERGEGGPETARSEQSRDAERWCMWLPLLWPAGPIRRRQWSRIRAVCEGKAPSRSYSDVPVRGSLGALTPMIK